jgi:hypothetical protein
MNLVDQFRPIFVSSDPDVRIKKLETENAELRAKLELLQKMYTELLDTVHDIENKKQKK